MFCKTVIVTIMIDGVPIKISISIGCVPTTPDEEVIRRARNLIFKEMDNATFKVV